MNVFISHKSNDIDVAEKHAKDLRNLGFNIYFDKYDPNINSSKDKAKYIQNKIQESTDLLVIITENTKYSWWVPFEIGVSTVLDVRIASIVYENSPSLPSFIKKWPIIDTEKKYNIYLNELQRSNRQLLKCFSSGQESLRENYSIRVSDIFHEKLMRKYAEL
ncbi:MAG: toll/interleukin-1 receptor domain-containing protein [Treponema sp.]|nr:toll/interleukin-1 receptor domain-containing protein [Treponema sp.]